MHQKSEHKFPKQWQMKNDLAELWTVFGSAWLSVGPDLAAVFLIPKSWMWWWSRISVLLFSIHCWPGSSSLLVVTFVVTSQYDGYLRHHQIWDILHNCHTSAQLLGEMRWEIFWLRDLASPPASHWIIIRTGHIFISSAKMNNMQNMVWICTADSRFHFKLKISTWSMISLRVSDATVLCSLWSRHHPAGGQLPGSGVHSFCNCSN